MDFQNTPPSLAFSHSHFEQILIAVSSVPLAFLDAELGTEERDMGSFQCSFVGRKTKGLLTLKSEVLPVLLLTRVLSSFPF